MRIIFFGTPEFATESLRVLVEAGCEIVAVITAPDRPKGRGKKLGISSVKEYALTQNLNILQPTNLKDEGFVQNLKVLKADLQIVVAFRMLPEVVWDMPPLGTFNLHASLLPQYRGAAPINWAIINGETKTGVTTFFLKHQIDTGNIIFQEEEVITPEDNAGSLYDRLMKRGAQLVIKTVEAIASDEVDTKAQLSISQLRHAPKIFKEDCEIDWNNNASDVFNHVRGLAPYPAAWTKINGDIFKIFELSINEEKALSAGEADSDGKTFIRIGTLDRSVDIKKLQLQGKKPMMVDELLRGYRWNKYQDK